MAEQRQRLRESNELLKDGSQEKVGFCWSSLSAAAATGPRENGNAAVVYPPSPPRLSLSLDVPQEKTEAARGIGCEGRRSTSREQRQASSESAADVYGKAESLCEIGKFRQAVPLFQQVISALHGSDDARLGFVEAEVWAHLGVTMQSLDDIDAAIDSYRKALELDPSLHVCFANLASLYSYMGDGKNALDNIQRALEFDPGSEAYLELQRQAMSM